MVSLLQALNAILILLFGGMAVLAWLRLGEDRWGKAQAAWLVTGVCFTVLGVLGGAQNVASSAARRAGSGSSFYTLYIEWYAAGNIGRSVGVAAYAVMLAALVAAAPGRARRAAHAAFAVTGAALLAGTAAGALNRGMSLHTQMTALAVLTTATVVALMVALLLGVVNDGMDLLLWLAVAAFTLKETLSVSLTAILAWWETARASEAALLYCWINVLGMAAAVLLARIRLRRASERRYVPALFERLHAMRRPAES